MIIAGTVFDIWGTYDPVFAVAAVFLLLAGLISFAIRERKYSVRYQVPSSIPVESVSASAGD